MKDITIFTPTYNRLYSLKRLYKSLTKQTNKNFIWLIVDDGSTDDSKKHVREWINSKEIEIKYIFQKNKGKQFAHNLAVEKCETEFFICVDSDDYLTNDAVEIMYSNKFRFNKNVAGLVFLRGVGEDKPIGTYFDDDMLDHAISLTSLYEEYHFKGDTALLFKTDVIKQFHFELFNNEKFIGEDYLYRQIEQKYVIRPVNEIFYITEYQEDGYTKNVLKHITGSPYSYIELKELSIITSCKYQYKFKHSILYDAMCIYIKKYNRIIRGNNKFIKVIAIPFGYAYFFLKFRRFR